jgi:hypothetical protein
VQGTFWPNNYAEYTIIWVAKEGKLNADGWGKERLDHPGSSELAGWSAPEPGNREGLALLFDKTHPKERERLLRPALGQLLLGLSLD